MNSITRTLSGQASPFLSSFPFYGYPFICKQFQHIGACSLCAESLGILANYKKLN